MEQHSNYIVSTSVLDAKSVLWHRDIMGHVPQDRGGFGLGEVKATLKNATPTEHWLLVVEEVRHQEAVRCARTIFQAKQGSWTRWDVVEWRKITWNEMWSMEANILRFTIRATYDVLPSPTNLHLWMGEDQACPLCAVPATLKKI